MGRLKRLEGWQELLLTEVRRHKDMNFEWGQHDCCFAVADCVMAMTGVDIAADFRNADERQVKKVLRDYKGVSGIADYLAKKFGIEEISTLRASTGDVVLVVQENGRETLGIKVAGGMVYCVTDTSGWVGLKAHAATRAWRI